jgi:predicted permease
VSIVIPISLAVAITSALFSVVDGLLLRPLPLAEADRLVAFEPTEGTDGGPAAIFWAPWLAAERDALAARLDRSRFFVGTATAGDGWLGMGDVYALRELELKVSAVSVGFFETMGMLPALGRPLSLDDQRVMDAFGSRDTPDVPMPAVISHSVWVRLFSRNRGAVGTTATLSQGIRPIVVVGVMPPGLQFPGDTSLWVPRRTSSGFPPLYGRLASDADLPQVRAAFPELKITPLRDTLRPGGTAAIVLLMAAAATLQLLAWVQVGSLLLAYAVGRARDIGVRLALGASHARITRQFVIGGLMMTTASVAIAWLALPWLVTFVVGRLPLGLTLGLNIQADERVLGFTCAASAVGLLLLSLLPASVVRRTSARQLLGGTLSGLRLSAARVRNGLLIAQIALTAVLLYLSGLAANSYARAVSYDYGFDAENVLVFRAGAGMRVDVDDEPVVMRATRDAIASVPGVASASIFNSAPFAEGVSLGNWPFSNERLSVHQITDINGRPVAPIRTRVQSVERNFLRTLGARLVAGWSFEDADWATLNEVAVVNETLARQIAPLGDAIGTTVRTQYFRGRVIGIVRDLVQTGPAVAVEPQLFHPRRQNAFSGDVILARTESPDRRIWLAIMAAAQQHWGPLPRTRLSPLAADLDEVLAPWRSQAELLTLIAVFGLPLAATGISGTLMYAVRSRTRETGIRLALGADPRFVYRQVVLQSLRTVTVGLAIGTIAGVGAARAALSVLFEVQPLDLPTLAACAAGLLAIGWLSARIPASRAARIQPADALRDS